MTNTKKLNLKQVETLVKTVSKNISKTEKDGFGLSIRGDKGIFNRRFLNPDMASLTDSFSSVPFIKKSVNQDGTLGSIDAIIMHGRTSTNHDGLVNTHPISKHGFHLCHNGVVEDSGPEYKMQSQNDTEHVVERFSQGISEVEKYISGYYAFATFQDNTEKLFIVRDNIASLYFAEVPSLDCHVFATTKYLIESALKEIGVSHLPVESLLDNTMLEYNGENLISQSDITPLGRSSYADSLASKSLGHSIETDSTKYFSDVADVLSYDSFDIFDEDTDSVENFLYETEVESDSTWVFIKGRNEYTHEEFLDMSTEDKLKMTVIRSDGTICSHHEDRNGLLWEGFAS